ncbi:MAG: ATP-grasp domain-containing protein [Candidatus Hodarchaeota archaeon]
MNQNKIFIFEFVSGGGFNNVEIPPSLFCEGFAMLRSIISDFKKIDFEISSLLDDRISYLSQYIAADFIDIVSSNDEFISKFKNILTKCRSCFIIAPEFSNILFKLTKIALDMNKVILSVNLEGIRLAASKILTYNYFRSNSILTPTTYSIPYKNDHLDIDFIIKKLKILNKPIIIKPNDGVGAELIYFFENKMQIIKFFENFEEKLDLSRKYILQEYIRGDDLSISLINHGVSNPLILSVNSQFISIRNDDYESQYYGGCTPVKNFFSIKKKLEKNLRDLDLTKFNSYFGIDFIKNEQNFNYFIEINPRLTTSYIGIRNIIKQNPVELILIPNETDFVCAEIEHLYFSKFCRLELHKVDHETSTNFINNKIPKLMKNIPDMVTPPITFNNISNQESERYSCFIATKTKDHQSSNERINQIIEMLKIYGFKVLN